MTNIHLIGRQATITKSKNEQLNGITGTITNETKNTITMNDKTYIKDQLTLTINGKEYVVPNKTPADRIKAKT